MIIIPSEFFLNPGISGLVFSAFSLRRENKRKFKKCLSEECDQLHCRCHFAEASCFYHRRDSSIFQHGSEWVWFKKESCKLFIHTLVIFAPWRESGEPAPLVQVTFLNSYMAEWVLVFIFGSDQVLHWYLSGNTIPLSERWSMQYYWEKGKIWRKFAVETKER